MRFIFTARVLLALGFVPCAACVEPSDVGQFLPDETEEGDAGADLHLERFAGPISASGVSTCALTSASGVACWGNNADGELGINDPDVPFSIDGPVIAKGLESGVFALFGGGEGHCVILDSGVVECWGKTYYISINGFPAYGSSFSPDPQELVGADTVQLVIGEEWLCLLSQAGRVKCWGVGASGNLGNGSVNDAFEPHDILNVAGERYVGLTTGFTHTCGATSAGGVMCWGHNDHGELGFAGPAQLLPTPVEITGAAQVAAGDSHNCVRKSDATVWCWGDGAYGQLGGAPSSTAPVQITAAPAAMLIASGGAQTCVLTDAGAVWCWGYVVDSVVAPTEVVQSSFGAIGVACGGSHACAINAAHQVRCWGSNMFFQTNGGQASL